MILAVVVFGVITIAITSFALLSEPDIESLEQRAQSIDLRLADSISDCNRIIADGQVDDEAIFCLSQKEYETIRQEIGAEGHFCIHLEDEQGNIIPISNESFSRLSIGSNEIRVGGLPCGS